MTVVPPWIADPALSELWRAVARRLERSGHEAMGVVRVSVVDPAARRAVTGLLGRPVPARWASVDLTGLDTELRRRAGLSLLQTVQALVGPVRDRPAERAAREAAKRRPVDHLLDRWGCDPQLAVEGWVPGWAQSLADDGTVLKRTVTGTDLVVALDLVVGLAAGRFAGRRRTEVAAQALGDAHGLDEGRLLTALVVRALAARRGTAAPDTAAGRRDLWEEVGVHVDRVSTSCLVVGVVPDGRGHRASAGRWLAAAQAGDPVHVTGWDLDRTSGWRPHDPASAVLVTENPTVLEAFARDRPGVPVICVNGHPRAVVIELLARLVGVTLRYHGDFDVAGLHITNRLVDHCAVVPWAMTRLDYEAAALATMPTLVGPVPPTPWDPALAPRMADVGVAVHEEVVLDDLLRRW